jgi:isopenicillin N synthase-like dioxygenase
VSVRVLDCRRFYDPAQRARFVQDLGEGLEDLGFIALANHGVPDALLERAYALADQTFGLPEAVKRSYETPRDGRQRGYTSLGVEHAKDHGHADLKEFWHVGRSLGAEHPLHASGAIPPNRMPREVGGFDVLPHTRSAVRVRFFIVASHTNPTTATNAAMDPKNITRSQGRSMACSVTRRGRIRPP